MQMNMSQLADSFAKAAQSVDPQAQLNLRRLAQVGVGYMKQEIQAAHAVDTGTMLNSTTAEPNGKNSYLIGPTVDYSVFVALGTSRMPARPFHISAARRLADDIAGTGLKLDLGGL